VSPLVNTEQSTLGTVISQPEVAKLPLSLRNWDDLIGLAAGVQGDRYTEQAGRHGGRPRRRRQRARHPICRTTSCYGKEFANATNITMPDGTKIFEGTDEPPK
jgi:hypothetical protein